MKFSRKVVAPFCLAACFLFSFSGAAQNPPATPAPPQKDTLGPNPQTRFTIEVTGGDKDVPVENASVYFKYVEEHKIKKNKKLEINVKTSRDGVAHIPDAPLGHVLVQVIAEGWKSYGRWYDLDDPKQVIKVHLERPPKWY
ncbi:MAG TPA: hypothetical protein VEI73_00490 [Candidatus Acidoferrum sp.]|nr:hypothetical protein [Candidatus Acidoferrum sp.]